MAAKRSSRKKKTRKTAARKPARRKTQKRRTSAGAASSDPRVAEIQAVIDVMVRAGAVEVELKEGNSTLRVRLQEDVRTQAIHVAPTHVQPAAVHHAPGPVADRAGQEAPDSDADDILSPMVGSFFRAASPEAESFVNVGDQVDPDTTLCIIEAMKVMNEIKAETSGVITEILVQNGEPVEYGQPLFKIRP